jgi:hypothetical protein
MLENTNNIMMTTSNSPIFWPNMEPWDFILTIISLFVLIAGILSILFILWWGLLLILSGWKDDKIKPAINTIRYAVIWIIVTVVSIFVFPILGWLLGIDVKQYANPTAIINKVKDIWQGIFDESNRTYWTKDWKVNADVDFTDL